MLFFCIGLLQMEPTDEFGTFYVHENGRLQVHVANSISSGFRTAKRSKCHNIELPSATTVNTVLHSCTHVQSLFDLCLVYVSANVQSVESLVGFPDTIGEKIFSTVRNRRILQAFTDHDCALVLRKFDEAYGSLLLEELTVRNLPVLEQHVESLTAFCHITKLDVTGCALGDNHDYLLHIGHLSL